MTGGTRCCPPAGAAGNALLHAARCLNPTLLSESSCVHNVTDAGSVTALGLQCVATPGGGFFLVSRNIDGSMVCTGGDAFRVWVNEARHMRSRHSTFASAVDDAQAPAALYWVNTTGGTLVPGRHTYRVSAVLLDSQHRALQQAEGRPSLQWVHSPVREWLRYRKCISRHVQLDKAIASKDGSVVVEVEAPPLPTGEPQCSAVPPGASTAMVALDGNSGLGYKCGVGMCTGDAARRVVNTFRGPKDAPRERKGFFHILKPSGCHFHWYDEAEVGRCLSGRPVLNIGGSVANSLQKGFERLTSRPKLNWWWDFGRTQVSNNLQYATGRSCFSDDYNRTSVISTV